MLQALAHDAAGDERLADLRPTAVVLAGAQPEADVDAEGGSSWGASTISSNSSGTPGNQGIPFASMSSITRSHCQMMISSFPMGTPASCIRFNSSLASTKS